MNRRTRNIVMIIALIILIAGTVFTVFHKEKVMYGGQQPQQGMEGMQPPTPPEGVPEGTTPPQPPGQQGQQPGNYDIQPQAGQQPPATPEGVPEGTTPPQPPGMNGQQGPGGQPQPGMLEVEMPTYFYFIFGAEGLAISCLLVFLIMSQMNKKSARYVFGSASKKMAFVVLVLALTAAITFGCSNITLPKPEPQQPQAPPGGPESSVAYSSINELF